MLDGIVDYEASLHFRMFGTLNNIVKTKDLCLNFMDFFYEGLLCQELLCSIIVNTFYLWLT